MVEWVKFAVTTALSAMVAGAAAQGRTQVGQLTCDISGGIGLAFGSQRTLNCAFTPSDAGSAAFDAGTRTKLEVEVGVTDRGALMWPVYAPTSRPAGALAGRYSGAPAEATVGAGIAANVLLVGGSNRTIALQPVSLQEQNVAAGVAGINLHAVR